MNSPIRNALTPPERTAMRLGSSRLARGLGRVLRWAVRRQRRGVTWEVNRGPVFGNCLGQISFEGRAAHLVVQQTGPYDEDASPELKTVIEWISLPVHARRHRTSLVESPPRRLEGRIARRLAWPVRGEVHDRRQVWVAVVAMDAITMLKQDHQAVERLFKRFEKAGDRAFAEKRKLADQIVEALSRHAAIEEQVFYPVARATVPGTEDVVLESLEEHHLVKWTLSELDGMDPAGERFDAKMTVLIENVRHHVKEEERELFPKLRAELDRKALAELGRALEAAKELAPSHPHPRSPDTPPGSLAAAAGVGMVDRISDTVSGVAQGSVTALQDLVALILGRRKRSAAPTGSKAARDTARDVRGGASKLTDDAIAAAVRAKETASTATVGVKKTATTAVDATTDTARVAKKSAKRTAATARRSAKRTASTAKRSSATRPPRARPAAKKAASTTRRTGKKATSTTS